MPLVRLRTEPLTPAIGAIVDRVDLSRPLEDDELAAIRDALDEHLVLFFPKQSLTPVQQRDFAARFGRLYLHPFYPGHDLAPEIMILEHDATHRANSDRWHNDVTYLATPPQAAVLYAEEIPQLGGDTLWANMYLAYESLSEPLKQLVSRLRAVHSFAKNFTPERFPRLEWKIAATRSTRRTRPVSHPVARTNPATGRKALFVNQDFTSHIEGVAPRESEALLASSLRAHGATRVPGPLALAAGTVAFWDNRWTQHCALADYFPAHRRMRRATILGERPV